MGSYGRKRLMWTELRWMDFPEKITRTPKMSLLYLDFVKWCCYVKICSTKLTKGEMRCGLFACLSTFAWSDARGNSRWLGTYRSLVERAIIRGAKNCLISAKSSTLGEAFSPSNWSGLGVAAPTFSPLRFFFLNILADLRAKLRFIVEHAKLLMYEWTEGIL